MQMADGDASTVPDGVSRTLRIVEEQSLTMVIVDCMHVIGCRSPAAER